MAAADLFPSWHELSSNGLMAILDNGPSIVDRFTAVFLDGSALSFAAKPNEHPGNSQWTTGGIGAHRVTEWLQGRDRLVWPRLSGHYQLSRAGPPAWMREHLLQRINDSYRDRLNGSMQTGATLEFARACITGESMIYTPLSNLETD